MQSYETEKLYNMDEKALETLVFTYRYPLTYFVFGYVKDLSDAEDIVSDTVVKLLVKRPRLNSESALKTYLFSTAKHLAIDFLRRRKKCVKSDEKIEDKSGLGEIEEKLFSSEEKRRLYEVLKKIGEEYEEVLYLYYFEDLNVSEICKVLKKNKKQVYNLLARAKAKTAKLLKKGVETDEKL